MSRIDKLIATPPPPNPSSNSEGCGEACDTTGQDYFLLTVPIVLALTVGIPVLSLGLFNSRGISKVSSEPPNIKIFYNDGSQIVVNSNIFSEAGHLISYYWNERRNFEEAIDLIVEASRHFACPTDQLTDENLFRYFVGLREIYVSYGNADFQISIEMQRAMMDFMGPDFNSGSFETILRHFIRSMEGRLSSSVMTMEFNSYTTEINSFLRAAGIKNPSTGDLIAFINTDKNLRASKYVSIRDWYDTTTREKRFSVIAALSPFLGEEEFAFDARTANVIFHIRDGLAESEWFQGLPRSEKEYFTSQIVDHLLSKPDFVARFVDTEGRLIVSEKMFDAADVVLELVEKSFPDENNPRGVARELRDEWSNLPDEKKGEIEGQFKLKRPDLPFPDGWAYVSLMRRYNDIRIQTKINWGELPTLPQVVRYAKGGNSQEILIETDALKRIRDFSRAVQSVQVHAETRYVSPSGKEYLFKFPTDPDFILEYAIDQLPEISGEAKVMTEKDASAALVIMKASVAGGIEYKTPVGRTLILAPEAVRQAIITIYRLGPYGKGVNFEGQMTEFLKDMAKDAAGLGSSKSLDMEDIWWRSHVEAKFPGVEPGRFEALMKMAREREFPEGMKPANFLDSLMKELTTKETMPPEPPGAFRGKDPKDLKK